MGCRVARCLPPIAAYNSGMNSRHLTIAIITLCLSILACNLPVRPITDPTVAAPDILPTADSSATPLPGATTAPIGATTAPTDVPTSLPAAPSATIVSEAGCVINAPPAGLGLDPFYTKYCDMEGLPIVAAGEVPDAALVEAARIVRTMLSMRPDIRDSIISFDVRVGVIGKDQVTTDMPEYADLYEQFPGTDWNTRARGLGATIDIPLVTGAEENVLCYPTDSYQGENILVHEFAHTMMDLGLHFLDPNFDTSINNAYDAALAADLWEFTYAATDTKEYWAMGVQSYFNTSIERDPPDGTYNFVDTRAELASYDPALFALIDAAFIGMEWTPVCPTERDQ
jgi:hypothetical protein